MKKNSGILCTYVYVYIMQCPNSWDLFIPFIFMLMIYVFIYIMCHLYLMPCTQCWRLLFLFFNNERPVHKNVSLFDPTI